MVNVNLFDGRQGNESVWQLPPWGHPLSLGVYPLLVTLEGRLRLVGTAFCVSKLGICATALHNVVEACKIDGLTVPRLGGVEALGGLSLDLQRAGLAVLHQQPSAAGDHTVRIWGLETVDAGLPLDAAFGFPVFQSAFPYLRFPLSFDVPRIGSTVLCTGYSSVSDEMNSFDLNAMNSTAGPTPGTYQHRLGVIEGKVTKVFTRRFAAGFVDGPCFAIDVEAPHGMSGGPVLNADGYVCGIVSAAATQFLDTPTTLVSMLYPLLFSQIRFGATVGGGRLNGSQQLVELVTSNMIRSDRSETRLAVQFEDGVPVPCPRIHKDDHANVHDDLSGMQEGATGTRVTGIVHRIRRSEDDSVAPS